MDLSRHMATRASLQILFVCSTMMAIYLTVSSIIHPANMAMAVTHVLAWPTERSVRYWLGLASFSSFFVLRVSARMSKIRDGGDRG